MTYPKHIEGTWQFNGDWFGSCRIVATEQDIEPKLWELRDRTCPVCEYPEAITLDVKRDGFPCLGYCPECGLVWGWYVARCPDCEGDMWKRNSQEGMVRCSQCEMELDIESIKEINLDPDFHDRDIPWGE